MIVEKPKPKQLLRPIPAGANSAMNQSQFLAISCNLLKAQEKWRVHGAIGFGFASHWLKNWRESFKQITKRNGRNHVITFDSHLKLLYRRFSYMKFMNLNGRLKRIHMILAVSYPYLKAHIHPKYIAPRARQICISCDTKLSKNKICYHRLFHYNRILHIYFNPPV